LNLSKTAYASFAFDAETFFIEYSFDAGQSSTANDRFTCQLLNKVGADMICSLERRLTLFRLSNQSSNCDQAIQGAAKLRLIAAMSRFKTDWMWRKADLS
jgi:hypothetical protein